MTTELFAGLCDDAAVFPPGNLPLAEAVPAHAMHERAPYAGLVGPFVLAAADLGPLAALAADLPAGSLPLSLVVPAPGLDAALEAVATIPAVRLVAVEVSLPDGGLKTLSTAGVPVFVEVPRDERRPGVIEALASSGYRAKLRTGGVRADLYPDERELAEAVVALAHAGVPFKATAGLHHALRNTDPETGFDQHGFLNLLLAAGAARTGAGAETVIELLADRDPETVVAGVRDLSPEAREAFCSFGTCSISEPVDELVELGLLPNDYRTGAPA